MVKMKHDDEPRLTEAEIRAGVAKGLAKYGTLGLLEQFAMFMGSAQILELGLKNLLHRRYGVEFESIERWTLGRVAKQLEERGLRADFIALLRSVVDYRNHIAHEFLAMEAMLRSLAGGNAGRLEVGELEKGIYELEQLIFLADWCEEHDAW